MIPPDIIDFLLSKPYWLIDVLPRQVPAGFAGQYFRVEEYFLSRLDEIRRKYGNNNVELVWTDADGRHTEVLPRETDGASTLRTYLDKEGVQINSYKELMPRMNDIFIKLVTEGEE